MSAVLTPTRAEQTAINFRSTAADKSSFAHYIFTEVETLHHQIVIEENTAAIIIEDYQEHSAAINNTITTDIKLGKNAKLTYIKIQATNEQSTHQAEINIHQAMLSQVEFFTLSLGAKTQTDIINVFLEDKYASCQLTGLYTLINDAQEISHYLSVNHNAPNCKSGMLFKGILNKKSKANFRGKVLVAKQAQKTQTSQSNHNLLLDPAAEVITKPELEIYADDIKCTHGATVGQLDVEALFYLQSRGIALPTAKQMLIGGFAEDIFASIQVDAIRKQLKDRVDQYVKS